MRYLLFKISLPFKDGIKILRLIRSLFRADKFSLYDVSEYLFKRHTVFLIHSKEKAREHDKYHCKCRNRRTLSRKKSGNPTAAASPKKRICLFVRLNANLLLTLVKSFGTGT